MSANVAGVRQIAEDPTSDRPEDTRAVAQRHVGRWIAAAVVLLIGADLVYSAARNSRLQWNVVGHYLFAAPVLHGITVTLELTALGMAIGIALGVPLAVMRLSANPVLRGASSIYVFVLRGTPILVQVLFWNFLGAVYPHPSLGVPFGGPVLLSVSANSMIVPFTAALLAIGLNEGAYMCEIIRAGIVSVDAGPQEAAKALGMTRAQAFRRIVAPAAMRVIIPPTGNETISMLKGTSIVSVIAVTELLYSVELIYTQNYETIPLLMVASIWYLFFTGVLSVGQVFLERRFGRGVASMQRSTRGGR